MNAEKMPHIWVKILWINVWIYMSERLEKVDLDGDWPVCII